MLFKPSGKYYATEEVEIDLQDKPWELNDKVQSGEISLPYKGMYRVLIPAPDSNNNLDYPHIIIPKELQNE